MATTESSPVLVQHVSPPHTLNTIASDVTFTPLSSMPTETQRQEAAMAAAQVPGPMPEPPPNTEPVTVEGERTDTPMTEAPAPETGSARDAPGAPGDTPTAEQPTIEQASEAPLDSPAPAEAVVAPTDTSTPQDQAPEVESQTTTPLPDPPPPPPKQELPDWVTWEDDDSTPTEDELKEVEETEESALDVPYIENKVYEDWDDPEQRPSKKIRLRWVIKGVRGTKERPNMARTMHSPCALIDGLYWQIKFFPRGNKSASLSAYIRCTKHLPNPDTEVPESTFSYFEGPPDANMGAGAQPKNVLHVPATPVEEKGSTQPPSDEPGTSGSNGGDSSAERSHDLLVDQATAAPADSPQPTPAELAIPTPPEPAIPTPTEPAIPTPTEPATPTPTEPAIPTPTEPAIPTPTGFAIPTPTEPLHATATGNTEAIPAQHPITTTASEILLVEDPKPEKVEPPPADDYRVSAQLGMVIYNPEEPRTCSYNSSEHQFTKHNDDWGWTNFVGPWNEIHIRQRGSRQALLKNDTIAIDAYIRIFEDPSQALWWHVSHDHESNWPSKKLAGYYPMGTPPLYHSPAVAGITAWLLLAPFRRVLQEMDAGEWRRNSQVKPRPLIARLQGALHLMRHLRKEDYVNVNPIIDCLKEYGETFNDVKSFWEAFRRSIELELEGEADALRQISEIFDTPVGSASIPNLPVKGNRDIQTAIDAVCLPQRFEPFSPNFLPLVLERDIFDKQTCEWKLCHDRVLLNDEISLPNGEKYTLYGFMVHVGVRNSGKFYSILRPNGLGTKWLAFEDGDGNKVFSYTRSRIQDYEGLVGDDLKNFKSTRQTAYMAMYIKTECINSFLPGKLEDYHVPLWLTISLGDPADGHEEHLRSDLEAIDKDGIPVEIYSDEGVLGRKGLLDMFNIKQQALAKDHFWSLHLPKDTTFKDVRHDLAARMEVNDVKKLRLFVMTYGAVGQYTSAQWEPALLHNTVGYQAFFRRPLCLWLSMLRTEDDVKNFGRPDPIEAAVEVVSPSLRPTDSENLEAGTLDATASTAPDVEPIEPDLDTWTTRHEADVLTENLRAIAAMQETTGVAPETNTERQDAPASEVTMRDSDEEPPLDENSPTEPSMVAAAERLATDTSNTPGEAPDSPASPDAVMGNVPEVVTTLEAAPSAGEVATGTPAPDSQVLAISASEPARDRTLDDPTSEATQTEVAAEADIQAPSAVEHGHLVDAVMSEAPPIPSVDAVTIIEQTIASVRQTQVQADARSIDSDSEPEIKPPTLRPVPNVYGFLQVFDADEQNFSVHSTFFAKRDEPAKEVVRKCMGFDIDKQFHAWHRETTLDGSAVDDKVTFDDINFSDGVDLIVGEILPDSKKEELRRLGKFSSPFALSRYLRMAERRHPIQARTSVEPVEIASFGQDYYRGPLVNGQPHGEHCFMITSYGHTYEGPLVMNDKDGASGKMTYQSGDVYEGEWKNNDRHGQGTFIEKRTGNKYVGGFQDGKRWGKGVTHWQVADQEAAMCQICYGEEIDALFFDCGHVCSCMDCAKQCDVCPICRRSVRQVVRMFWA